MQWLGYRCKAAHNSTQKLVAVEQSMKLIYKVFCLGLILLPLQALAKIDSKYWPQWDRSNESNGAAIDHREFDGLLREYVVTNHPSGINRFRYPDVSRGDKKRLDSYVESMAALDPRDYNKAEQKAYWLNLYNALTIREVLKSYPVQSMDKSDYQTRNLITVAGTRLSLNDIENRIVRPLWRDHKVIFGMNCAAIGCPHIQNQAYTAANTRDLLKKGAREFINHPRGLVLDKQEMLASRIFDWYRDDFGTEDKQLMKLFAYYADDNKALYILGFSGNIQYAYDSRINAPETVWPVSQ